MRNSAKSQVRADFLARRRALAPDAIRTASQHACQQLAQTLLWQQSQHIAFYVAHDNELDPSPLLALAHSQHKTCYLPHLAPDDHRQLLMIRYQPGDPLANNRYGIPEPLHDPTKVIAPDRLNLVLVPLVAFDKAGTRLGMGLGYYDQTFAFLNQQPYSQQPQLAGLAYHFQEYPELARDPWDVGLDLIVTDQKVIDTTGIASIAAGKP